MTVRHDDPIVALQARALIELEAKIRMLEEQSRVLERTIADLESLIAVYQKSRAVRMTTAVQGTQRSLAHWARTRTRRVT